MELHLGCALALSFTGLIIMRLFTELGASTTVSIILEAFTPASRARPSLEVKLSRPSKLRQSLSPLAGSISSGYVTATAWRWMFWCAFIIAGMIFPFVVFLPETFRPIILTKKAEKLRKDGS